jgi:multicomponent Na+:H+ antiporter subunit G
MLGALLAVVGGALLVLGLLLATIGLYGLLRRRNVFHQLHAAGLVTGPATLLVLLAAVGTRNVGIMTSAALVILFVLMTAPLAGHAIAQAAFRRSEARPDGDPGPRPAAAAGEQETGGGPEG